MNRNISASLLTRCVQSAQSRAQALFFKGILWVLHRCGIPTIVCLCGSTRFFDAFQQANLHETLARRIILTIGCDTKADGDLLQVSDEKMTLLKKRLDWLHKRKIDIADEILVLNVGSYVGQSTQSEIEHARRRGKRVRWLEVSA